MKRIISLLTLFLYIQFCSLYSLENIRYEYVTNEDGLSHNTVRSIMQDKQGFMWFGTINGLNRYDGHEIIRVVPQSGRSSLSSNSVRRMMEDYTDHIWILSASGTIDCYDTRIESFVDIKRDGKNNIFRDMKLTSNGDVWLWGKDEGACKIQCDSNELILNYYDTSNLQTNHINFIFEDSDKQIWIGTDKNLSYLHNDSLQYIHTNDISLNFQQANQVGSSLFFYSK